MGADADVILIGPYSVLKEAGVLDYDTDEYEEYGVKPNDAVTGTLAQAASDEESRTLAAICCVDLYDLPHHKVFKAHLGELVGERIGDMTAVQVYDRLKRLLDGGRCLIWFRPNK